MDVKKIISRINNLSHKEKYHILNILNANDIEYTKNTNGYFFNFLKIDNNTLDKIIKCLQLIEQNVNLIKEMDKKRNDLINSYKIIIEEKLNLSFEKRKNEYIKYLSLQIYETNINYNIKRITHIRKNSKFSTNNCNQAELILKEYQKSQTKFKKNSVYHRIYSTIKMNKRYTEPKIENESNNNNSIEDINDEIENIDEIENYDTIISEDENKSDMLSDEYDDDDNISYNSENSDNETDTSKTSNKITPKEKKENDINYYKNLLYQQGFIFDNNKTCFLIKENYIL